MANYFVINSKFRPYSFDELIKPYQMYAQEYNRQEALLDAAKEKEFSPDYLDQKLDSTAYNMYNAATQNLQAASDELATNGLSSNLRTKIRSTARDYQRTMNTLNEAQQRLYAERERRAKLGDDYRYQQEDLRIGDFLNGATPNSRSVKLSDVTKDVAAEFGTIAKTITKDTWDKVLDRNGNVVSGYYDVGTEYGLTKAQLDTILSDDRRWEELTANLSATEKQDMQRLRQTIAAKKRAIGYDKYSPDNKSALDDAIRLGATAGLGTTTHQYKKDEAYIDPATMLGYKKFNEALAETEEPYQHEENKPASRATRLKDENGNYKLKSGYVWLNGQPIHEGLFSKNKGAASASDGSGSSRTTEKPPYIGVVFYDKNGKASHFKDDAAWDNKYTGVAVTDGSKLSDANKRRLALLVQMNPDDSAAAIFEEATRRGISVSVIEHKNKENQEMIARGTKSFNLNGNAQQEEDQTFNPDD